MRRYGHLTTSALLMALLGAVTACSESPTSPGAPEPEPPPATQTLYDLKLTVEKIVVSSDEACDGRDFFGNANKGEFHYRIEGRSEGSVVYQTASAGYGSVLGTAHARGPGGTINFADRTFDFSGLGRGAKIDLRLLGIEWDLTSMDRNLKGQAAEETLTMGAEAVGSTPRTLDLGSKKCGLTLHYQQVISTREVPTG